MKWGYGGRSVKKRKPRKRSRRRVSQRQTPPPVFDAGGGMGPADALVELARPLLDLAGDNVEAIDRALTLAMLAWNAESLPEAERDRLLRECAEAAGIADEDLKTYYEAIDMLIRRKRALGFR
jgi:hypothetical protein